jgi:hypothetical protein
LSAAARKRIAAAQKKRWAAFHKAQKPAPKKVAMRKAAPNRTLSPKRKAAKAQQHANALKVDKLVAEPLGASKATATQPGRVQLQHGTGARTGATARNWRHVIQRER